MLLSFLFYFFLFTKLYLQIGTMLQKYNTESSRHKGVVLTTFRSRRSYISLEGKYLGPKQCVIALKNRTPLQCAEIDTSRNVHFNVPSRPRLSLFLLPLESLILLCSTCPWSFSKSSVPCCWMLSTGHSWMWWRKTLIFLHQHGTYCPCFYPLSMIAVAHKSDEGSTGDTNPSGIREAPGNVSGTKKASHCRLEEGKHSSLLQQTSWIRKKKNSKIYT